MGALATAVLDRLPHITRPDLLAERKARLARMLGPDPYPESLIRGECRLVLEASLGGPWRSIWWQVKEAAWREVYRVRLYAIRPTRAIRKTLSRIGRLVLSRSTTRRAP